MNTYLVSKYKPAATIPRQYKWEAVDSDGGIWLYLHKPTKLLDEGVWDIAVGGYPICSIGELPDLEQKLQEGFDWTKSLRKLKRKGE